jgi:DNA-binding transcriptional MerR regulator
MNINEASKACGLTPSVLRIWELRYGWPNPKRKANGYRTYGPHLVEDLKRMAGFVKQGIPIRLLIVDGLPSWPNSQRERRQRRLERTRALSEPTGTMERALREDIIKALESHRTGLVLELLQRCAWQVRPQDELLTGLAPVVMGVAELRRNERPLVDAGRLDQPVLARARQLLRILPAPAAGEPICLRPEGPTDETAAVIAVLALRRRGLRATLAGQTDAAGPELAVGCCPETLGTELRIELRDCCDPAFDVVAMFDKQNCLAV